MISILLMWFTLTWPGFYQSSLMTAMQARLEQNVLLPSEIASINPHLDEVRALLSQEAPALSPQVIDKVITSLHCATKQNVVHNNILTIIDYSLPSNAKRLWVFDLQTKKRLFNTYVSHGIRSGTLLTDYFSNQNNSKASSMGVYKTEKSYYGREGLSLRLDGLERHFNDNAANRSVVMHGGWYVEEDFIKRYGRPGRSWGCPALPLALYQPIINTIKDNSLMVVYYPSDEWFVQSRFLTCEKMNSNNEVSQAANMQPSTDTSDTRDEILFVDLNKNGRHEEREPIVAISADNYERIFHAQVPLSRMLRRQINTAEYVALSSREFGQLASQNNKEALDAVTFVIPEIIMVRGYYETQMKIVPLGKINEAHADTATGNSDNRFVINLNSRPNTSLKASHHFIRWVGL